MVRYLSPEWITALDDAARSDASLAAATSGVRLVLQQQVDDAPGGAVSWHLLIDDGSVRVLPGEVADPDVVFHQHHDTAVAIARGSLSAQTAFMVGRLTVTGDVASLLAHQEACSSIEDVFAPVRAATEY